MSALEQARDKLGLTKRKKLLGLPIGPKQTDWRKAATWGAGAGAGAGTLGYAGKKALGRHSADKGSSDEENSAEEDSGEKGSSGEDRSRNAHDGVGPSMLEKGKHLVEASPAGKLLAKPKEMVEQGKAAAASASEVGDKVSRVSEAVNNEDSTFGKVKGAVQAMSGDGDGGAEKKQRLIIQEQIDIAVPRSVAYDRWADFEGFDEIFRAVQSVDEEEGGEDDGGEDEGPEQQWQAKILVSSRTWTSEITDQTPEKRIAWTTTGDVDHQGAVTFHELAEDLTRIHLEMEYHPTGFVEKFGNLFLTVRHRVRKDLRLFKHQLEMQGGVEDEDSDEDEEEQPQTSADGEHPEGEEQEAEEAQASDEGEEQETEEAQASDEDEQPTASSDEDEEEHEDAESSSDDDSRSMSSSKRSGASGSSKSGSSRPKKSGSSTGHSSKEVPPSRRKTSPAAR